MWPGNARCAVALTFDFDAEELWIADDPSNANRPGVLSQGAFGAKVGLPLVLEVLARHEVAASFFVPGRVAEAHPDRVREIVAAGHEVGHHGYTHRAPSGLSREEEEDELRKGTQVLEGFGVGVRGYRAPAWDPSEHTIELLREHGFSYSSNLMDDVRPYRHGNGIVELPVQWMLDDAPHFWFDATTWDKKISTTAEVRSIWEEELLGIRELGGLAVFTMHPQIIGRPGRARFLDDFIGWVRSHDDVWVTTCSEIAQVVD